MRKFYLITNLSGCTYWSYKVTRDAIPFLAPMLAKMVLKYGDLYVNQAGGWMTTGMAGKILKVVEATEFPVGA